MEKARAVVAMIGTVEKMLDLESTSNMYPSQLKQVYPMLSIILNYVHDDMLVVVNYSALSSGLEYYMSKEVQEDNIVLSGTSRALIIDSWIAFKSSLYSYLGKYYSRRLICLEELDDDLLEKFKEIYKRK